MIRQIKLLYRMNRKMCRDKASQPKRSTIIRLESVLYITPRRLSNEQVNDQMEHEWRERRRILERDHFGCQPSLLGKQRCVGM